MAQTRDALIITAMNLYPTHSWCSKTTRAIEVLRATRQPDDTTQRIYTGAEALRAVKRVDEWLEGCRREDRRDYANTLPIGVYVYDGRERPQPADRLGQHADKSRARKLGSAEYIAARLLTRRLNSTTPDNEIEFECFDGGAVPKSYGYQAYTDHCTALRTEGRLFVYLQRTYARKTTWAKGTPTDYMMDLKTMHHIAAHGQRMTQLKPTILPDDVELAMLAEASV